MAGGVRSTPSEGSRRLLPSEAGIPKNCEGRFFFPIFDFFHCSCRLFTKYGKPDILYVPGS